jgi:hypothetical protein
MIDIKIAKYVTDILLFDSSKVIISRENFVLNDFADNKIFIDTIANRQNLGSNEIFDDTNENMTYVTNYKQIFTIDFIGSNAETNVNDFLNLQNSERAYTSSKNESISVLIGNNINKIKDQKGNEYYNRYQVEVMVYFYEQTQISQDRFDEAQTVYLIDK